MDLWPTQGDEKRLGPATTLYGAVALSFVIPSEAEGSAVPRTFRGNVFRPERSDLRFSKQKTHATRKPCLSPSLAEPDNAHEKSPGLSPGLFHAAIAPRYWLDRTLARCVSACLAAVSSAFAWGR